MRLAKFLAKNAKDTVLFTMFRFVIDFNNNENEQNIFYLSVLDIILNKNGPVEFTNI